MKINNYFDRYGGLHHVDTADLGDLTSENAPLFTGTRIAILHAADRLTSIDAINFINYTDALLRDGIYFTTPNSDRDRFSHDNMTGLLSGLYSISKCSNVNLDIKRKASLRLKTINKVIGRSYRHPRDILFWMAIRLNLWPLTLLVLPFEIISCWQTYKIRNGNKIIKTDGKILALTRHCAFKDYYLIKMLSMITFRNREGFRFTRWGDVMLYYFLNQGDHPNVTEAKSFDIISSSNR